MTDKLNSIDYITSLNENGVQNLQQVLHELLSAFPLQNACMYQQIKEVDVHRRVQDMFAQHVEFYRAHLFTRAH